MISKEEMEDIVKFVLRNFNCDRKFKFFFEDLSPEEHFEKVKEVLDISERDDRFEQEHGTKYKDTEKFKAGCYCEVVLKDGKTPHFVICIHPKIFSKRPVWVQRRDMIHEARHIVEYPHISTDKESRNIDIMLLREYTKKERLAEHS